MTPRSFPSRFPLHRGLLVGITEMDLASVRKGWSSAQTPHMVQPRVLAELRRVELFNDLMAFVTNW